MEKKWNSFIDGKMKRYLLWIGSGMFLGYIYYLTVGCASGACPISSNPLMTILYGGAMGWLLSGVFEKTEKPESEKEPLKIKADHREKPDRF